jgi:isopenicillin N synthase-like dioxygenase
MSFTSIPTFHLPPLEASPEERLQHAAELLQVCHEVGFFFLLDHGIEQSFFDSYFAQVQAFFALPETTKSAIDKRLSPHFRGWERIGAELTDNRVDYREQLDMSTEHDPYPVDDGPQYLCIDGPNQWLPEESLPGFRSAMSTFVSRCGSVADSLMELMSIGLGFDEQHLHRVFGERRHSLAKIISYPTTPPGQAGVNAHHDAGFLTLLVQHKIGGLQALNPSGEWIDVDPPAGALVVNLGEMLQAMTGNFFVATTHRVIATQPRLSSAYFHGPDLRTPLVPLALDERFGLAVAGSQRHATAGFMAKREELLGGRRGTTSTTASTYGEQLWNYYGRSYPDNVRAHYPDAIL